MHEAHGQSARDLQGVVSVTAVAVHQSDDEVRVKVAVRQSNDEERQSEHCTDRPQQQLCSPALEQNPEPDCKQKPSERLPLAHIVVHRQNCQQLASLNGGPGAASQDAELGIVFDRVELTYVSQLHRECSSS